MITKNDYTKMITENDNRKMITEKMLAPKNDCRNIRKEKNYFRKIITENLIT